MKRCIHEETAQPDDCIECDYDCYYRKGDYNILAVIGVIGMVLTVVGFALYCLFINLF